MEYDFLPASELIKSPTLATEIYATADAQGNGSATVYSPRARPAAPRNTPSRKLVLPKIGPLYPMASDGDLVKANKVIEEKEKANESLYNTIVEKQAIIDQLEKEVRITKEQRDKAESEIKNTRAELNSYANDVRSLQKELEVERADVDALRSSVEQEKKRGSDFQKREDRLETELDNCRKQNSTLQDERDHFASMNSSLHDALDRVEDEKSKAEQKSQDSESIRDAYDAIHEIFEQKFALLGMDLTPESLVDYLKSFGQLDDKRASWNGSFDIQIQPGTRPGMKDRQVSVASLGDELLNEELDSGDEASLDHDFASQKPDFALQRRLGHRKKASTVRSEAPSEYVPDWVPDYQRNNAVQDDVTDHGIAAVVRKLPAISQMRYKATQTPAANAPPTSGKSSEDKQVAPIIHPAPPEQQTALSDETNKKQALRILELEKIITANDESIEILKRELKSSGTTVAQRDETIQRHMDRIHVLEELVAQHKNTSAPNAVSTSSTASVQEQPQADNDRFKELEATVASQTKTIAELRTLAFKKVTAAASSENGSPKPEKPRLKRSPTSTSTSVKHIVHVRDATFGETIARAPLPMKILMTAMFIVWAALCLSAYYERSIWVSANDTAYTRLRQMQFQPHNTWLPSGLVNWMESLIKFDGAMPG